MSPAAPGDPGLLAPARWTPAHVAAIDTGAAHTIPHLALDPAARHPVLDLWDMWPVEHPDGTLPRFGGASLWMVLSAPRSTDPEDRHGLARIRLMSERDGRWTVHGPVSPDGFTPGDREWSGSAILDPATARLTTFFTAAGRRGDAVQTFEQRLFQAEATLADALTLTDWSAPVESIVADGTWYMHANQREGAAGTIKAFRDPAFFRDPADGRDYLLFTGSCASSSSRWNGVIGVAEARGGRWHLLPPLATADGLNNELERPHLRRVDGLYYLFWSTQRKVFADGGPAGPTGLYGMVAPSPLGPFAPLNGTGLVAGNPADAPGQAYSWWVLDDLRVNGFVDLPAVAAPERLAPGADRRAAFGGYPTPFFRLALDGATARIA